MSSRHVFPMLFVFGLGALIATAASQQGPLAQMGQGRRNLAGASPLPEVEICLGSELAAIAGSLRETVNQVPRTIRDQLGFAPQSLQWRDSLEVAPFSYQLRLRGLTVGTGQLRPGALVALQTVGTDAADLPGEAFDDPVSGRRGVWIEEQDAGQARLLGFDVLDASFLMALHVDTLLRRHLHELLTREEAHHAIERARHLVPRTVQELLGRLPVGVVQQVLRNLLREQVSLRDLPFIVEALTDAAEGGVRDPEILTERLRLRLARQLTAELADLDGSLKVIPIGFRWDQLREAQPGDPVVLELIARLRARLAIERESRRRTVLLAPQDMRAKARRLIEGALPDLPVLSEQEVDPAVRVVRLADLIPA
ncbi:MAG: FHIPEP family type III secretion protein [Candidatus Sericytochromatia bacterium]|nr:FHIPEP family type III secretion protein [Candidatus Sericytochromatia bacterium]